MMTPAEQFGGAAETATSVHQQEYYRTHDPRYGVILHERGDNVYQLRYQRRIRDQHMMNEWIFESAYREDCEKQLEYWHTLWKGFVEQERKLGKQTRY